MDGILPIDKEHGITSYDVIRKVKKALDKKVKIGHAGTLDPFATGLLLLLFGKATKLQDAIHVFPKGYIANAKFGFETDTLDSTGEVVHESDVVPSKEDILSTLPHFTGEIEQTPPRYSAVKVDGQRAYKLAREGKEFDLKSKKVTVHKFELLEYKANFVKFEIICSSGTYIRSLISDLGRELGTYATTDLLSREFIGDFKVNESLVSSQISAAAIARDIIPINKLEQYAL